MHPLQRLPHRRLVQFGQMPEQVRVGVASHSDNLRAGGQLRADAVRQHHCHLLCQLLRLPLLQALPAHKHLSGNGFQMPGDGF